MQDVSPRFPGPQMWLLVIISISFHFSIFGSLKKSTPTSLLNVFVHNNGGHEYLMKPRPAKYQLGITKNPRRLSALSSEAPKAKRWGQRLLTSRLKE